jgi:hypothetical protein
VLGGGVPRLDLPRPSTIETTGRRLAKGRAPIRSRHRAEDSEAAAVSSKPEWSTKRIAGGWTTTP